MKYVWSHFLTAEVEKRRGITDGVGLWTTYSIFALSMVTSGTIRSLYVTKKFKEADSLGCFSKTTLIWRRSCSGEDVVVTFPSPPRTGMEPDDLFSLFLADAEMVIHAIPAIRMSSATANSTTVIIRFLVHVIFESAIIDHFWALSGLHDCRRVQQELKLSHLLQ